MESTLLNVHHLKREVQDNFLGHHSAVHHLKREVQDNFPSNYIQTPYSHQSLLGLCHLQGRILTNAGASDFKSLVRMLSVLTATSFQTSGGKSPLHLWLLSSAAGLDATFYDESFDSLPDDWKSPGHFLHLFSTLGTFIIHTQQYSFTRCRNVNIVYTMWKLCCFCSVLVAIFFAISISPWMRSPWPCLN